MLTISRKALGEATEAMMIAAINLCDEQGLRVMVNPDPALSERVMLAALGLLGPDLVRPAEGPVAEIYQRELSFEDLRLTDPMKPKEAK